MNKRLGLSRIVGVKHQNPSLKIPSRVFSYLNIQKFVIQSLWKHALLRCSAFGVLKPSTTSFFVNAPHLMKIFRSCMDLCGPILLSIELYLFRKSGVIFTYLVDVKRKSLDRYYILVSRLCIAHLTRFFATVTPVQTCDKEPLCIGIAHMTPSCYSPSPAKGPYLAPNHANTSVANLGWF